MNEAVDPTRILDAGFGFWSSKALLTAIELEVFTVLNGNRMTGEELGNKLGLHPRGIWDFFDTLVALKFLERDGNGREALYGNTTETARYLDKNSPAYMGGILEMCNARLYKFWNDLGPALKSGQSQNEVKHSQKPAIRNFVRRFAAPGAIHGRDGGSFAGQLHGTGREVRFLEIPNPL